MSGLTAAISSSLGALLVREAPCDLAQDLALAGGVPLGGSVDPGMLPVISHLIFPPRTRLARVRDPPPDEDAAGHGQSAAPTLSGGLIAIGILPGMRWSRTGMNAGR